MFGRIGLAPQGTWEPCPMRAQHWLIVACGLLALCTTSLRCCNFAIDFPATGERGLPGGFLVRPYLQLGEVPSGGSAGDLRLLWQAEDMDADWAVDYRPGAEASWRAADASAMRRVDVPGVSPHRVYRAILKGLEPGGEFAYRVRRGAHVVFTAVGHAPKAAGQPYRFAVFGDCAAGTAEQKAVAFQTYRARPDFVLITGDIVYTRGRISEYREKFWPVYGSDVASMTAGAPLLRSTLFVGAPGNHDVAARDLAKYPDGLAYFLYWDQPLNGPIGREGGRLVPTLVAPEATRAAFLRAAGPAYPRMANFSFDYGNAHWTVLDSNPYVDWTDPDIRGWVERDLADAQAATWRFVAFHHPPFNSSRAHFGDQRMRVLAEVFEAGRVDVVWSGHVHNYQRTFPLTFRPDRRPDGTPVRDADKVPGRWTLDTSFDGRDNTRPLGVIYVITGAGGATLYNIDQQDDPASWQPYTHKFVSRINSLTVADVDGPTLTVRQVSANGQELDRFVVTK
jgi:3',5'-cyclic AMP phosphodiesterase CpdA